MKSNCNCNSNSNCNSNCNCKSNSKCKCNGKYYAGFSTSLRFGRNDKGFGVEA